MNTENNTEKAVMGCENSNSSNKPFSKWRIFFTVVMFLLSVSSLAWISYIYLKPSNGLRGSPAIVSTIDPTTNPTAFPTLLTTFGQSETETVSLYTANCSFAGQSDPSTFLSFSTGVESELSEEKQFDWAIFYQSDYGHGYYCSEFDGESVNGVYANIHQAGLKNGQIMAVGTLDTSESTSLKTDYFGVIPNEVWCAFLVEVTVNETSYRVYDIYSRGFQNCDPYPQSVYDTNGFTFEILAHADVKVISGQNTWMELIIGSMNIDPNVGQQLYIFFSREVGHSLVSSYKRVLSLL